MAADHKSGWLKGVLDLLVLSCLVDGESYGYEISKALTAAGLGETGRHPHPVLNRLEKPASPSVSSGRPSAGRGAATTA